MNRYMAYNILVQTREGINARISLDTMLNEMILNVAGFYSKLCDPEEFQELCDRDISSITIGQEIVIDGVQVIVLDVYKETTDEFNAECERIETQNCIDY